MRLPRLLARTAWQTTRFGVRTSTRAGGFAGKHIGKTAGRAAVARLFDLPDVEQVPNGRMVKLRGRGKAFVVDVPGPTPDAPTVVLLHGLGAGAQLCWVGVLHELTRTHRVIALDQRWHGRGIHSPRFRITDCADDVAALLKTLGVRQAVVAGYSMGGPVAQEMWRRHPERVSGLVLASTSCNWRGHLGEKMFFPVMGLAMDGLAAAVQARVAQHALRLPESPDEFQGDLVGWGAREFRSTSMLSMPEVLGELGRFNSTEWIGDIDVPTAVVITTKDKAVPAARQRAMAAAIRDVQIFEAPGGHASVFADHANWSPVFLDAVRETTARTGRAARTGRTARSVRLVV
ncbi:alpha/beta fold hydrolase [Nocardioides sp.]|uniref:alpha/beta fold hydrolase n=1 Tax=Nocardioides sp. TaxID=35761 RepID=UPI00356A5C53